MKILLKIVTLVVLAVGCADAPQLETTGKLLAASYEDDESNCGAEGYECAAGRECIDYRCEPAWIEIEDAGAPTGRHSGNAGTVTGKYVVFGGCDTVGSDDPALDSSGVYDPGMDSWSAGPTLNDARCEGASVTTDWGVSVIGGLTSCQNGTAFGPGLESLVDLGGEWIGLPSSPGPTEKFSSSLTWTGNGFFVFGGADIMSGYTSTASLLQLGAAWQAADCPLSGCERGGYFTAFEYQGLVHVLGGDGTGSSPDGLLYDHDESAWYNWIVPSTTPDYSMDVSPNWTQADDGRRLYRMGLDNTIWIYDRVENDWVNDDAAQPMGLCARGMAAWVGSEYIIWGGYCGSFSDVGARYQPPAPGISP